MRPMAGPLGYPLEKTVVCGKGKERMKSLGFDRRSGRGGDLIQKELSGVEGDIHEGFRVTFCSRGRERGLDESDGG